uniref:ATP synthase subunit a n=1 Tax=Siboglinum plumosum TaxID=3080496 RepID=A0AA96WNV4_9ANNE|nr:ATP synthase F0 subunit 6 [Siboglinum plumosum]WNZ34605.1 ATP synthase F0 subunit 6 [Siboglinum plumosum]
MMPDIFSSFDQNIFFSPDKVWLLIFLIPLFFFTSLWINLSFFWKMTFTILLSMFNQASLTQMKVLKSFNLMMASLFFLLICLNLLGLTPYMFSISSHLIFSLTLSIPLWLSLLISSFSLSSKKSAAHLLPSGAPSWLNPFLVTIETTSILVRPLTLAFRLAANMSAGHIILILVSSYLASNMFMFHFSFFFLLMIQMSYFLFEIAISLIQAFIFCLLLTLYSNDHAS